MPVTSIKKERGFIWFPKSKEYHIKITINDVDVTKLVYESEFRYPTTIGIGNFRIKIINPNNIYTNSFKNGDDVKFYADLTDATTIRFWGKINKIEENVKKDGQFLDISGNHRSRILLSTFVNKNVSDISISDLLKEIIDEYADGFSYANVETSSKKISVNWNYKPFWECVRLLCSYAGYDCYVDNDLDFHFFESGSKINNDEAVVEGDNLVNIIKWGRDEFSEKSRVMVMGKDDEGIPILHTSISPKETEKKEAFIRETTAKTEAETKAIAEAKLSYLSEKNPVGKVECLGLEVDPGDTIWVSLRRIKTKGKYKIIDIIHRFGSNIRGWKTNLTLSNEEKDMSYFLVQNIRKTTELQDADNPNKMLFSYNFTFDNENNIETNYHCEISNGELSLISGFSSGYIITTARTHSEDISYIELRHKSDDITNSEFFISVDNGSSWEKISKNTLYKPSGIGKKLKLKIILKSNDTYSNPKIKSVCVMYK